MFSQLLAFLPLLLVLIDAAGAEAYSEFRGWVAPRRTSMKRIVLAVFTIVGLAGCAASQAPASFSYEPDLARVQAINSQARAQGVQVLWINLPTKAVKVAGG